jgi:hypothetical protein
MARESLRGGEALNKLCKSQFCPGDIWVEWRQRVLQPEAREDRRSTMSWSNNEKHIEIKLANDQTIGWLDLLSGEGPGLLLEVCIDQNKTRSGAKVSE